MFLINHQNAFTWKFGELFSKKLKIQFSAPKLELYIFSEKIPSFTNRQAKRHFIKLFPKKLKPFQTFKPKFSRYMPMPERLFRISIDITQIQISTVFQWFFASGSQSQKNHPKLSSDNNSNVFFNNNNK